MPQFRVIKKSTRERIYVDKIDPVHHLQVSGGEWTSDAIRDVERQYGSNSFKKEETVETPVEKPTEAPKKAKTKK